jgi:hypothetical protein
MRRFCSLTSYSNKSAKEFVIVVLYQVEPRFHALKERILVRQATQSRWRKAALVLD